MDDLYDILNRNEFTTDTYDTQIQDFDENMVTDPLLIAEAAGLAEALFDEGPRLYENVEELFDDMNEEYLEMESFKKNIPTSERNIPAFEKMVMKRCGLFKG